LASRTGLSPIERNNNFFVRKLLSNFAYPLGVFVGAIAVVRSFASWRRFGQVLLVFALVALWLSATPLLANWLSWYLESQFPPVSVAKLPRSDVVIVLGGVGGRPLPPGDMHLARIYRTGKAPLVLDDPGGEPFPPRLMRAMRIYLAGKAPQILLSAADAPEAQLNATRLIDLGAPRSALTLEAESQNTRENAVNAAAIFEENAWRTGLLVTSGVHMPRAFAAFKKVGLNVTPAATDIHVKSPRPFQIVSLGDLLPDAGALNKTMLAIRELIGLAVYRCRGWA
jgi:uncharacterized SAM-binding protein YcdF (DUF218 family)